MKKVVAVWMLMLCTIAAQAQLMGPGYVMGNQQEKINARINIYKALYEAADKNDCATFKKLLDTGIDPNLMVEEMVWEKEFPMGWEDLQEDPGFAEWAKENPPRLVRVPKHYYLFEKAEEAARQGHLDILKELQAHKFNWKCPNVSDEGKGGILQRVFINDSLEVNKRLEVLKYLWSLPEFQRYFFSSPHFEEHYEWRMKIQKLEAEVEAAKSQQQAVQREVKASLPKKK